MSKRFTLKQAQKLIADWLDNEDNDTENVEFDDSSDESEHDQLEINSDADDDVCDELPTPAIDRPTDDDSADCLSMDTDEQVNDFILSKDGNIRWYTTEPDTPAQAG